MPKKRGNPRLNRFEPAAVTVLHKAKQPLTLREIVERMIELSLITPIAKTPQNSLSNTIRRSIEKRKAKREPPLFVASRDGTRVRYSLK
jgi:hypothetical protein